jgi:hypothetical protein
MIRILVCHCRRSTDQWTANADLLGVVEVPARLVCVTPHPAWTEPIEQSMCAVVQIVRVDRATIQNMTLTTHSARITGPVAYDSEHGDQRQIPLGPCLVELDDGPMADIVWGAAGENSAALSLGSLASAEGSGHLVMLD